AAHAAAAPAPAPQGAQRVNEANRRPRDPLRRAADRCERRGTPIEAESNTHMCTAFLMEQMLWREALDEAADDAAIDGLHAQVMARQKGLFDTLDRTLDDQPDSPRAAEAVRSLMFVERFLHDIERRRDALHPL
ncbi:MAG: iron-sulfur cluster co-chaperone HscB C-terminal domain-containing protein, partial [Inhella sp.]